VSAALTFLGAAGTVTGARFLVEAGGVRLLLECGMFQGLRELRARNWTPFPVEPRTLAAVLLSHAHIDHSGYLPRLARDGFAGPIFCSPGTADLLRIMLPDAARLQEEEAEWRNRQGTTTHRPALPLFTAGDAERVLALVRPVAFEARFEPAGGVAARFHPSGHILGASIVEMTARGRRLVYSGDLGRYGVPVLRDPVPVEAADTLLVESTYGDRLHPADDGTPVLVEAVARAVERRGMLLVPAFAVGRTQDLLYLLRELEEAGRIPTLAVYLDSPMAIEATAIYAGHPEEHDAETARVAAQGRRPFVPARFHLTRTPDESKRLNGLEGPAIVIAGSGMATGGRILHHLRHRLPDERTTVLFVGYQAAGTRGRLLREGAEQLRIFGEAVPVRARILATDALSAHADRGELLVWLSGFRRPPAMTYTVHGEPTAAAALRDAIARELGWACAVAADAQRVPL
jgi:metallo-beta-lactamase family protein